MLDLLPAAMLFIIATLFAWSILRAWRANNRFIKWGGAGLAALLSTAATLVSGIVLVGLFELHARSAPALDLKVAGTPEQIGRGRAISISHWSDGDIFRAIRNSVDRDGHWLVVMSYTNASKLSDDDTMAVIAYIRGLPAAGTQTANPPDHINLLGMLMLGAGMLPKGKPVSTGVVAGPSRSSSLQLGEYILSYQDCRACHGDKLTGGVPGQLGPLGPDLNLVKGWKLEQFIATMRTGVDPNGHQLDKQMPWQPVGRMSDEELGAVYEYLTHLPG